MRYTIMKKEDLYNKIINNVAKEVKKTLNEKYGVIEFNNTQYINKIQKICSYIHNANVQDVIVPEISKTIKFCRVIEDFSNTVNWLKKLNIYVTSDPNFVLTAHGDSIVTNIDDVLLSNYYKKSKSYYFEASIFICISGKSKRQTLEILHHEIAHLFDATHNSNNDGFDIAYSFMNGDPLFIPNRIWSIDDLNNITIKDIHAFLTYCLYYANVSETHAFAETINFQLVNNISDTMKFSLIMRKFGGCDYVNISNKCSPVLDEYYWLHKNLELLIANVYIDQIDKYVKTKKCKELNDILGSKNLKQSLQKLYSKIKHTYNNGIKLFNYYMELYRKYDISRIKKKTIVNEDGLQKLQIFSYKVPNRHRC